MTDRRGSFRYLAPALVVLCLASPAFGQSRHPGPAIFWESQSTYQAELVNEFSELYTSLRKVLQRGLTVPLQRVESPGKATVLELLRNRRQFFGSSFPRSIDLFTCDLNPGICTVQTDHTHWRTQPDDTVVLPAITFEPIILHRMINVDSALPDLVVSELKGCERFDAACQAMIKHLNLGTQALKTAFRGRAVLPVRGYRASIPLEPLPTALVKKPVASPPDLSAIRDLLPVNASLLPRQSIRGGKTESSHADATLEGDRARILTLINHPLATGGALVTSSATNVAVVDRWVFPGHCVYTQGVRVGNQVAPDPKVLGDRSARCGMRKTADLERDHGTHLVGLIAARPDAPSGPGVDPTAHVRTVQMDPRLLTDAAYGSDVAKVLREITRSNVSPRIFNLSFTYPFMVTPGGRPSLDSLESFIRNDAANRLIVAAAGSGLAPSIPASRSCGLRPTCIDARNVITVAATDLTPRPACPNLLASSNRGAGVDIAAPGLNVLSAIVNDHLGTLSGTSQAVPLVTGALSLLFAKNDAVPLLVAKNRVIYTADQCPGLDVLGGRLNVGRALQFETSQLMLAGATAPAFGHVVQRGATVGFTDVQDGKAFRVQIRAMKRLTRMEGGSFRIIYHPEAQDDERTPLAARLVTITKTPGPLQFSHTGTKPPRLTKFDVATISDYVGAIDYLR